jgi:hypothetical protein
MAEVTIIKSEAPDELEPPDAETGEQSEEATPEAPYGYKADGTPRKRPGRKPGSGGGGGGSPGSRSLASLREPLTQRLVEYCGAPLALASPLAYSYWELRAEKTADSLLIIAARSKRTEKWIRRLITGSAGGDLGITLAGVGTAFLVDTGKVDPGGKVPHFFGLDNLYVELYGAWEEGASDNGRSRGLYAEVG